MRAGGCSVLTCLVVTGGALASIIILIKSNSQHGEAFHEKVLPLPPNFRFDNLGPISAFPTADPESCQPTGCTPALCSEAGALASCVPFKEELRKSYLASAHQYFHSLDPAYPLIFPPYGDKAARFEWPPWVLVTGYPKFGIERADSVNRNLFPYTVPMRLRECWVNETNPFARCRVMLWPSDQEPTDKPLVCQIYEEFTFDRSGKVTFVEAWSDNIRKPPRLSTRVPGLGTTSGQIDIKNEEVWSPVAAVDEDVNGFWMRTQNILTVGASLVHAFGASGGIEESYDTGCHRDHQKYVFDKTTGKILEER